MFLFKIAVLHYFNFLIASINKENWGQTFSRMPLEVSVHEKDNEHCVSACVFELHSSAALNKHTENNFDDCDVNHSCIKTMSHSPKLQLLVLNPSAPNPSTEWFNKSSQETVCYTHTMYNSSGPLVAL